MHTQRDGAGVGDDNGSHCEVVRCQRGDDEALAAGSDDGTSGAERIGGRSSGCRDDDAVAVVGCDGLVVDAAFDGDHSGAAALYGCFIDGQCRPGQSGDIPLHFEHGTLFDSQVSVGDLFEEGVYGFAAAAGKKTHMAGVDAHDRDRCTVQSPDSFEQRTVSAEADHGGTAVGGQRDNGIILSFGRDLPDPRFPDCFGKLFVYSIVESVTVDGGKDTTQFIGRVDDAGTGKKEQFHHRSPEKIVTLMRKYTDFMTKLSVNINKIAVLRNSRGGNLPDVVRAALDIERFGADGITVHPRPDGRHIRYDDVRALHKVLATEFNIEGNPIDRFIALVEEVRPTQVTLVPDAADAITSNAGWDTVANRTFLTEVCAGFKALGIRTSIFVDPVPAMVEGAAACGADRVELYTEAYARNHASDPVQAVAPYVAAAEEARRCGLGLNAGHDLNLDNLRDYLQNIPWTDEVSIGHALICDALYLGLENTVGLYKRCLNR